MNFAKSMPMAILNCRILHLTCPVPQINDYPQNIRQFMTVQWVKYWLQGKQKRPGGWINIKMPSYQYRKSHCGDKTILRPSYLHNGISYTGKTTSLYWIAAQGTPLQARLCRTRLPSHLEPIAKVVSNLSSQIQSWTTMAFMVCDTGINSSADWLYVREIIHGATVYWYKLMRLKQNSVNQLL